MEIHDLIKKLRKYEIRIRKAINHQMQGDFHSVFKGSGLEFDDVRLYQYGDDVRAINWNVSAKGHGTYIKTFKEEKEQIIFFILDVSASQEIGQMGQQKIDIGKEICGVLTLSAIKESSQVGLICFSDQKEKYIEPGKGTNHALQLISDLYRLTPKSVKTNLKRSLGFALNILKRKSIIILISDFIDIEYEKNLRAMSNRHDLVVIHLRDLRETNFPRLGIIPIFDKETKKTKWVNTSSARFRKKITDELDENKLRLEQLCRKYQADYLAINTNEDYIPSLIRLFNVRKASKKIS